ncbi:hypothetical protein, partial [Vibrio hyugaensis]|uniref:hypothetical protein n=1 Tax=Vibrio hyugaensis TaxID=1534743 RepID=UPI003DA16948
EWPKGADCKSAGTAFDGSNPSPSTILKKPAHRAGFFRSDSFYFYFTHYRSQIQYQSQSVSRVSVGRTLKNNAKIFDKQLFTTIDKTQFKTFFNDLPLSDTNT